MTFARRPACSAALVALATLGVLQATGPASPTAAAPLDLRAASAVGSQPAGTAPGVGASVVGGAVAGAHVAPGSRVLPVPGTPAPAVAPPAAATTTPVSSPASAPASSSTTAPAAAASSSARAAAAPTTAGASPAAAARTSTAPVAAATSGASAAAPVQVAAPVSAEDPQLFVTHGTQLAPPTWAGDTRFGVSIPYEKDERVADTVARYRAQFGGLPAVRIFGNGVPTTWDSEAVLKALGTSSSVIWSFKGDMDAIASGTFNERLTRFLASRPAGVKVWVALHHEPEDDVERGAFTAAQFRAATARIAPAVRAGGGIPTTILMAYTLQDGSGRDWHDYYTPEIDVLAWDAYNSAQKKETQSYKPADKFVEPVLKVARETGKAFGWAEFGSPCIVTDPTCSQRAAWLTSVGTAARAAGGEFLTYWNRPALDGDLDFSLKDAASVGAWRRLIAG